MSWTWARPAAAPTATPRARPALPGPRARSAGTPTTAAGAAAGGARPPSASRLRRAGAAALGARRPRRWAIRHSGTLPEGPADHVRGAEATTRRPLRPALDGSRASDASVASSVGGPRPTRQWLSRRARQPRPVPSGAAMLRVRPTVHHGRSAPGRRRQRRRAVPTASSAVAVDDPSADAAERRRLRVTARNAKERPHRGEGAPPREIRRRPTLPGGLPPSTIGAGGLNFRVRNGNGCDPAAMATEICCQSGAPADRAIGRRPHEDSIASTNIIVQSKPSAD